MLRLRNRVALEKKNMSKCDYDLTSKVASRKFVQCVDLDHKMYKPKINSHKTFDPEGK